MPKPQTSVGGAVGMVRAMSGIGARRSRVRVILGVILVGPLLAGLAVPVLAECNPAGADVAFTRTAPYAQRILVGRVVDSQPDPDGQGPAQDGVTFSLQVKQVLRGPSTTELPVDHLETGGCIRWLSAADGDLIALAFETQGSHPPLADGTRATMASATAAWIEGEPRISDPYEVLTMAEVLEAAAMPRTPDTAMSEADGHHRSASVVYGATVIGSLAMLLITGQSLSASVGRGQRRVK
jgi:hypothetical protein